jgi:hypothetical protein
VKTLPERIAALEANAHDGSLRALAAGQDPRVIADRLALADHAITGLRMEHAAAKRAAASRAAA